MVLHKIVINIELPIFLISLANTYKKTKNKKQKIENVQTKSKKTKNLNTKNKI
jgi:hypothetical protein